MNKVLSGLDLRKLEKYFRHLIDIKLMRFKKSLNYCENSKILN